MYIPDEKIEEVRAATDLVEVVGDYVRLKRRGSNYLGLCPFHNEKTPSFNVSPSMGIFKCFGCGVGGDVFQFVMRVEHVGFPEAIRSLAERAGIPLPEERQDAGDGEVEAILHALRFAARFFYAQLTQSEAGLPALDYLRGRGFTAATIKRFGLGYAPDRWDGLLEAAAAQHIPPDVLEGAGLVLPRRDGAGHYDRFRGRVIFPIFSHVGKVLGFGGRILTAEKDQPKYINSPETRVYSKSHVLYGLYQARQAIRKHEEAILVEGYTDVMALHQAGVEHVVASSGTALTADQVKLLGRYARRVLLLYDADAAGAGAALRGIDLILTHGLSAYAVALPPGDDPDAFVKAHGGEAFQAYVQKHRQDFVAFKHQQALRSGVMDTPDGSAEAMRGVVASVALMPDPLLQESYLRRAAEVLGVPDIRLYEVLGDLSKGRRRTAPRPPAAPAIPPPDDPLPEAAAPPALEALPEEKLLLRLMLEHGTPMVELILGNMSLEEFTQGPLREAMALFLTMYESGEVVPQRFLDGSFSPHLQHLAAEVLMDQHEVSQNWKEKLEIKVPRLNQDPRQCAADAMTYLKLDRIKEALAVVARDIHRATEQGGDLRPLQERMMALHELRKRIERREYLTWNAA